MANRCLTLHAEQVDFFCRFYVQALILMDGYFRGLAGSRHLDQETLLRCLNHLDDSGALVFNIYPEYADAKSWMDWLEVHREAMPELWPEEGRRRETPDGTEYVTMSRMTSVDPLEQSYTREMRVEKWRA